MEQAGMNLSVPTIEEQTGWKRPMSVSICQNCDVLLRVREWDFDLNNSRFLVYAKSRGVLYKAGEERSKRFATTANHDVTESSFKSDPVFQRAEPSRAYPEGYIYSNHELEIQWQIMLIAKGTMQDAWELFTRNDGNAEFSMETALREHQH